MTSNALGSSQQSNKGGLSLFTLSEQEILNQIYSTHHVHDDEKFDVESLFIIVENILKRATVVVDNIVLGTQATVEDLEEKTPKASFSPPICALKNISCEMQCKAPGEEIAHKTALTILNKLSKYSWDTKAVLTLAAFALDYGEFWQIAQAPASDQLAKSVGTLRRVPMLLKRPTLQKHRQSLIELNNVIKATLEVIECVFELEKLSNYDTKDVPALSTGVEHIPVDVYWAIATVVASTTQFCCLINDEYKKPELSPFSQKLNYIVTKLKRQITIIRQQIEVTEAYWKLVKVFRTPAEIMEIFKGLIYTKDNVQPLIDGSTKKPGTQVHLESLEDKTPKANFNPPLCTLKKISSEMQCKTPGEEIAHKTTMSILNKLSSYSWDAKAVLTLAAFALEYGDFWLLAQLHPSDQLAKSIGILKRVPVILRRPGLQKHRRALVELNNLIKATLEVIECIFELEKLSIYDTRDVPALLIAMDRIPVDVYWAIITVVACSTKMCGLTNEEDQVQELSHFAQKLNIVLSILKKQIQLCKQQIEDLEAHRKIKKLLQTPNEIMEVFKALIYAKNNLQLLIDGSTQETVSIEVLKKKNILLFISGVDISIDEISILKPIYDAIRKEEQYKIVWIPIVDQWNDDTRKKFEMLKSKMPWYVVQYFSPIAGIRFIKEEWHFKNKPIIVVMNPKGKVECPNAIHMIRVWGMRSFPFSSSVEEALSNGRDWMGSIVTGINPNLHNWIKEEKYIFFYGGKDKEWIQQFTESANALANDPVIKDARVSIELLCVGKSNRGEDDHSILGHFWNRIDSFFFSKTQRKSEPDPVTHEIQKLLSYKNESGWAVLSKGSRVVVSGHGTSFLKVLEELEKWKEYVRPIGFEVCFKEYHDKLLHTTRRCCRVDIPITTGKNPEHMKCPECPRVMEAYISFKCCHIDGAMNGLH